MSNRPPLPTTRPVTSTELVKKTTLPTARPVTKQIKLTTVVSTVPLPAAENNRQATSAEQNSENKRLIIVSTVSALIAMVGIMCLIAVLICKGRITPDTLKCRWNRNSNNIHEMEASPHKQTVFLLASAHAAI